MENLLFYTQEKLANALLVAPITSRAIAEPPFPFRREAS
jgi:hypothetical protein